MKKSRICWIRILFPVFAILIFSVFLLTIKVNAASDQYYFPMEQNKNSHFSGSTNVIDEYFNSDDNFIFVSYVSSNWGNATDSFVICYYPKSFGVSLYGEIYSNAREFGLYKNTQRDFSFASFDVYWYQGTTPIVQNVTTITPNNFFSRIFVSSSYSSNADYVSNYQIYTSNNVGSRQVVLLYSSSDNEEINDNNTIPDDFTKPDINNYFHNWSNSPSFDSSSVESALNSVFNSITWFANNINSSISGLISYVVDSVNWGLQMVINNIRGKLQEVKNSIDSIVSGIGDVLDTKFGQVFTLVSSFIALGIDQSGNFAVGQMFTSLFVPSTQVMMDLFISHDVFNVHTLLPVTITAFHTIFDSILNATVDTTFHVPSLVYHGEEIGDFDIDFSWFLRYKVYSDLIISSFLVLGYVYWVVVSISHFLRGQVGQGSDPSPTDNYAAGWHYDL